MKKRKAKVDVFRQLNINGVPYGKWHWHLKSPWNGEVICAGQPIGYSSRAKARAGYMAAQQAFINGVEEVS